MLPVVVCIDVEPDQRLPRPEPLRFEGFERLIAQVPALRDRMAAVLGHPPTFTWALRMDPHIEAVYGSATWVADTYRDELEALTGAGDVLGVHPHTWRLDDGTWWSDNADAGWVAHCVQTSLSAYRSAFDAPCTVTRCGDRFMSEAIVRQLGDAGVVADLSVEPGLPETARLAPDEPTRGSLPDTRSAPAHAYRISPADFRRPVHHVTTGLVELPLTPALVLGSGADESGPMVTCRTLVPWTEPSRFAARLSHRLSAPHVTHLAFALRSDVALIPGPWSAVQANLLHLAEVVAERGRIVGAEHAATMLGPALGGASAVARRVSIGLRRRRPDARPSEDDVSTPLDPEPPPLVWEQGVVTVTCRACGDEGPGRRVARTLPEVGCGVAAHRCERCGSLQLVGPHVGEASTASDEAAARGDRYVEHHGAVEVIAQVLSRAGHHPPGTRALDIGCGYGFGPAVAGGLWGWDVQGVDPGSAARRGARDLGHRLHAVPYRAGLDLGGPVDVVLACEVLEHVPDPRGLLVAARSDLSDQGVLVLSTPAAEAISATTPLPDLLPALGIGEHVCLFSAVALEAALRDAGFAAVQVDRDGATLQAVAAVTEAALAATEPAAPVDLVALGRWTASLAHGAASGSALRVGMAARSARFLLHASELDEARASAAAASDALQDRHGLSMDDPAATRRRIAEGDFVPIVAGDVHLTLGVLALHAGDLANAATHLLSAAVVAQQGAAVDLDPSVRWMEAHALGQAAVALARTAPDQVPEVLSRLASLGPAVARAVDVGALLARGFTELVAAGAYDDAILVTDLVPTLDPQALERGGESRRAALDASFMRAMLELHRGDPRAAEQAFQECARVTGALSDDHARNLAAAAAQHALVAAQRASTTGRSANP